MNREAGAVEYETPGAIISPCGTWRYKLWRPVARTGLVFAFSGVNCSKAGPLVDDQTTMKWAEFTRRNGGRLYFAINPFALRSTDVRGLATAVDPVGPDNARHVAEVIAMADVLVPCWGNRSKVPKHLRYHLDAMEGQMRASGKPMRVFGLTKSGDPTHPLMLGYSTPLVPWERAA